MPGLPQAFDLTVLYAAAQTVLPAGAPLNIEAAATLIPNCYSAAWGRE